MKEKYFILININHIVKDMVIISLKVDNSIDFYLINYLKNKYMKCFFWSNKVFLIQS